MYITTSLSSESFHFCLITDSFDVLYTTALSTEWPLFYELKYHVTDYILCGLVTSIVNTALEVW